MWGDVTGSTPLRVGAIMSTWAHVTRFLGSRALARSRREAVLLGCGDRTKGVGSLFLTVRENRGAAPSIVLELPRKGIARYNRGEVVNWLYDLLLDSYRK